MAFILRLIEAIKSEIETPVPLTRYIDKMEEAAFIAVRNTNN